MKKTIILDERYPFYSGYTFRESLLDRNWRSANVAVITKTRNVPTDAEA